jgi:hypothetical protein
MIDATSLLIYRRWDIIIKYVYIKYFDLYCQHHPNLSQSNYLNAPELKWFRDLYTDHLKVLNGGYEISTYYQETEKKTLEEFLNSFHSLYFSIKKTGFDSKHTVPVGIDNIAINGAHRIAISSLFNIQIPIAKINIYSGLNLPPYAFNDRTKYKMPISNISMVISGLTQEQQEFVLREYVQIKSKDLRFLVVYDHNTNQIHESYLKQYLEKENYHIIHHKDIKLNIYGAFQFLKNLYFRETKVNITLKTAQTYLARYIDQFPEQFTTRVYLIESNYFNNLSPSGARDKTHLRHYYGSDHSLHVTDNSIETIQMSTLIYHQQSIDYLNLLPLRHHHKIDELFLTYMKILEINKKDLKKEQFIIVSSFLLGLFSIRNPSDIDFIYDSHLIKNKILEKSSHNKYIECYPDLFTLLYNPTFHFYYFSLKVINLEQLKKMKILRNERKDYLDIQLIDNFNKYSSIRTQLSIITTTHAIPSAPSTKIIEMCLKSFYNHFPGSELAHHWIYFDSREDEVSLKYWKNLQKLTDIYPNLILIKEPHSGLKPNYLKGLKNSITPFFMFLEHDWIFQETVDLKSILNEFQKKNDLHYLKFNKRDNYQRGGWDQYLIKDNTIKGFTAIKTNSWTNHPHLARRHKWLSSWIQMVTNPKLNQLKGSLGIEDILYRLYQFEIGQLGFEKAHQKWGCYNYGSKSGKYLIQHIDGSERYDIDSIDGRQIKID